VGGRIGCAVGRGGKEIGGRFVGAVGAGRPELTHAASVAESKSTANRRDNVLKSMQLCTKKISKIQFSIRPVCDRIKFVCDERFSFDDKTMFRWGNSVRDRI
jgi:hypothetical protein